METMANTPRTDRAAAADRATTPNRPTRPGPIGTIRPLYGVFIRDQFKGLRVSIDATLTDVKKNIALGKPRATAVANDGILQGAELKRAKAAAKDLQKALDALSPVVAALPSTRGARANSIVRPMYGVVLRDDLSSFRNNIEQNLADIEASLAAGGLTPQNSLDAKKAIKALKGALKDLGNVDTGF